LVVPQVVAIIFIAEFFDWRLLEKWPDRLAPYVAGMGGGAGAGGGPQPPDPKSPKRPKIVIVGNRKGRTPLVSPLQEAFMSQGFDVGLVEGDAGVLGEVTRHLLPDPQTGRPGGIVFNAATRGSGEARLAQVPALLEMEGIPYTGPGPLAHALFADRFALLSALARVELPVPRHELAEVPTSQLTVAFPAAVRPRGEPDVDRIIVGHQRALHRALRFIGRKYKKPAVVEEIVLGRKISAALLGNETIECLPLVELSSQGRRVCPAALHPVLADRVRAYAQLAYRTAGCRDYGRVDFRLASGDDPVVIDVKCSRLFARHGVFMIAAAAAGYDFATVMLRIVNEAALRYVVRGGGGGGGGGPINTAPESPPIALPTEPETAAVG
jgi:D-alanine-D-alanine ligase